MNEAPWKLCELCHTEPVDHGRICETCKSLDGKIDAYTTKRCNKCGEFKLLDQFDKDKHAKDRKTNICKQCRRLRDKERHKANMAKKANGLTCMHPPEQSVRYESLDLSGDIRPICEDDLRHDFARAFESIDEQAKRFMPPDQLPERKYKVTIDFSDCPWLLAYLEGESLSVSLQIKRRLIDSMSDGELRSWLLTGIVV